LQKKSRDATPAQQLDPDEIVMGLGLPVLNGVDSAGAAFAAQCAVLPEQRFAPDPLELHTAPPSLAPAFCRLPVGRRRPPAGLAKKIGQRRW
jgi:hypothetical protein